MVPIGSRHAGCASRLNRPFKRQTEAVVREDLLPGHSEPDIGTVRNRRYAETIVVSQIPEGTHDIGPRWHWSGPRSNRRPRRAGDRFRLVSSLGGSGT